MAGSYNHIITNDGNFVSGDKFVKMIENLGDAYEMVEEMYGMIWWLAHVGAEHAGYVPPEKLVEMAQQDYQQGLRIAKANKNKTKHHGH